MKKRNFYLLFFAGCFVIINFSCFHPAQNEVVIPSTQHLVADTVCPYQFVFSMGTVFMKNGHIFMIDPKNAGSMYIYNVQTDQKDYYVVNTDMDYPESLLQHLPFSFYQNDKDSYYTYLFENDQLKLTRESFRFVDPKISNVVQIGENQYVSLGGHAKLLGLFDGRTSKFKSYGHYPLAVTIPVDRKKRAKLLQNFQGNIDFSQKHSTIVYGSKNCAYLSSYRYSGGKLKLRWEKQILPLPSFELVDGYLNYEKTEQSGNISSVVTAEDYIFASFVQRNNKDSIYEITYSILVYNIKGTHITTLYTDCPISIFAVDLDEKTIYGVNTKADGLIRHIVRLQFNEI